MKLRVPIWTLMAAVPVVAVGLAALQRPFEWVASAVYTMTVGVLLFALAGIVVRRGNKQLFWTGFAVFGWGYFVHAWANRVYSPPRLLIVMAVEDLMLPLWGSLPISRLRLGDDSPQQAYFIQTCHSFIALLCGLFGIFVVQVFATKKDDKDNH